MEAVQITAHISMPSLTKKKRSDYKLKQSFIKPGFIFWKMDLLLTAINSLIVEPLVGGIKKHLGFLISARKHVEDMNERMNTLELKANDARRRKVENEENSRRYPSEIPNWLIQVEKIKEDAESVAIGGDNVCFNMKMRHNAGKRSSDILKEIERLIKEEMEIKWNNEQIPLGEIGSDKPTTSDLLAPTPVVHGDSTTQNNFKSRELTFEQALKSLDPNNNTQKIALCGMGGVGKTTMMEQLKNAVENRKMFNWVMKADIGQNPNTVAVQQAIADYMGGFLTEKDKGARADRLHERFEERIKSGKKILVILDDLWKEFDLKDIGLTSPLPNGIKLLLTSRFDNVCSQMGATPNSIFKVSVLNDEEAKTLFFQSVELSDADADFQKIGEDIAKKCGGLPIAIKTIASSLKDNIKDAWEDALSRLKNHDLQDLYAIVKEVFGMSYDKLKSDDDKDIFLLCGLFPDDSNIRVEDLRRYGWGLKLFKKVYSISDARKRTNTCVNNLIRANLLIESNIPGCVKMHDLVREFVLSNFTKLKQASVVNHDNKSEWPKEDTRESCERILLDCRGMSEFPVDFNYPNLTLLILLNGDKSLKFPEDFYERMKKIEVIAYAYMRNPLHIRSLQCSTNLRSLCLYDCELTFDCFYIEHLVNLEILSFADCGIEYLPSTIGKLSKLKLLDLSGSNNLSIDDGIFQNLKNLEELYLAVYSYMKPIRFTEANCNELSTLSTKLRALEIEFFKNMAQPENVCFENLQRFRISVGCSLTSYSLRNTLRLVTNRNKLMECKINELFEKTEELFLQVKDMHHIEEFSAHPSPQSFCNLRDLEVSNCADLTYLFTIPVASCLTKLERLNISSCPVLKKLIHGESENSGGMVIKFQYLKHLILKELPELISLCDNLIELPRLEKLSLRDLPNFSSIYSDDDNDSSAMRPILKKEVKAPELEILEISFMENLKQLWSCTEEVNISMLRVITVEKCDSLVNLFPTNPMSFLIHLEELEVKECGSVEVLFNIDLECAGNMEQVSSRLRTIYASNLGKLREVWRIKGSATNNSIRSFQSVLRLIKVEECDNLVNLFPTNPMPFLSHLEELNVEKCGSVEVLFNIDLECAGNMEQVSSRLRTIYASNLGKLREVWRIKGYAANKSIRSFQAVESINIEKCKMFRNIFTPKATSNFFHMGSPVDIVIMHSGESKKDSELVKSNPHQEINDISKDEGDDNNVAFPSNLIHTFHHLHKLHLNNYEGMEVVFEIAESRPTQNNQLLSYLEDLYLQGMEMMSHVWKCWNWKEFLILHPQSSFHNLTIINMFYCKSIKYLFSPLMANLLSNLKEIYILSCDGIEEVVSNRDDDEDEDVIISSHTNTTLFPRLDILNLAGLNNLRRIDGGVIHDRLKFYQASDVSWSLCQYSRKMNITDCDALSSVVPSYALGQMQKLQELKISYCEGMTEVFETQGINNKSSGDVSSSSSTNIDEGNGGTTTLAIPRLENINVARLSNLKKLEINQCNRLQHVFTFSTLKSLMQLQVLKVNDCNAMKVIVNEENGEQTTNASNVVVFPSLKSVELVNLRDLKGFFLGMNDFQWPLLDKVVINNCPQIMMFTYGQSTSPKLKYIHTSLGKHSLECGLNLHVTTTSDQTQLASSESTRFPANLECLPWSFHNLIEMDSKYMRHDVKKIIPSNELLQLQKLEKIHLEFFSNVEEVFEIALELEGSDINSGLQTVVEIANLRQVELKYLWELKYIWKSNKLRVVEFPNLTTLSIFRCEKLEHVFTSSMLGSLQQLQDLSISDCRNMEVIVKEEEEECDFNENEIKLLCLKSLELEYLGSLKGFCLGKEAFSWPSLDTLVIKYCPAITVFTNGHSTTPKLQIIETSFGMRYVQEEVNSFIKNKQQQGLQF